MSHAILIRLQADGLPRVAPYWLVFSAGIETNLHIARATRNVLADIAKGNRDA